MSDFTISDFEVSGTGRMSVEQLADAYNQSFAGYFFPMHHDINSLSKNIRSFSLGLSESMLARHWDGRLAGLAMLGLRGERCWCGGFGITEEFRGKGLSHWLAGKMVEHARSLGLSILQLEVLAPNVKAFQTYQKAGFQTTRELIVMAAPVSQVLEELKAVHTVQLEISEVSLEEALHTAIRLEPAAEYEPCWQREPATLLTMTGLRGFVARRGGNALAVLIYQHNPDTGRISIQNLTFYNESAAKALLERAAVNSKILRPQREDAPEEQFYILNEPENSELFLLLTQLGLQETIRQFEMIIGLN